MKVKLVLFLIVLLILGTPTILSAQNTKETERTVDELYLLTNNPEFKILDAQAKSNDRQSKMDALDGIEKMIKENNVNKPVEVLLINLAGEGTFIKQYEGRVLINNFPEVRRKACTLLGEYGGEGSAAALINVLKTDDESMVLSEAAYALGIIGKDADGKSAKALADLIEVQSIANPDSNLAYAVILAFQKLAAANNGLKDPSGYDALIKITQGNYIKGVKKMALDTLLDMKKYN